ncbi:MAG: hypothetical protein COB04_15265 [Gammaproteobacteria bacterium]|nr:MAG: hypothetical protein COB04_15265 [Gammaproteobacteria bacterium]
MKLFKPVLLICAAYAMLSACATQDSHGPSDSASMTNESSADKLQPKNTTKSDLAPPIIVNSKAEQAIPARPFTPETLYALLVAELAVQRNRLDVTLGQYTQQAHITRDTGVVSRANRIAKFMNAKQATLDTALLWLEIEPDSIEAHQTAAATLINFGRYNDALEHIDHLLTQKVAVNFDYLVNSARQLNADKKLALSVEFKKLTAKHPNHPKSWFTYAILMQLTGNLEQALSATEKSLALNPEYVSAKITKGKLLASTQKPSEGLKYLARSVKRHPEHVRLRVVYAQQLISSGEITKAQKEFAFLVKQSPQDGNLILSLSLLYLKEDLVDEAELYLKKLLPLNQRVDEANFHLARIYQRKDNPELALKHLDRIQSGSLLLNARIQTASILFSQGDIEGGRASLANDRALMPQDEVQLYLSESDLLAKQGLYTEALSVINFALEQHPENNTILYSRAMVSEKLGRIDQLEIDLRNIISEEPNNAAALNALGYTLADRTNRHAEALQYITQAMALTPGDPAIIDSMGWVQYRLGNLDEAIKLLREAIVLLPDPEVAAHLGEVLWVAGQQEEATRIWTEALENKKDSKILKQVMNKFIP